MRLSLSLCVLLTLAALLATGCADSVSPTGDVGRPYTLYGVLDPEATEQSIRVVPFAPDLNPRPQDTIDAVVTSTNLNTGEVIVWEDSLVNFGSRGFGHVFTASFQPVYTHTYRIEVERSDGALSSVEVAVPPFVEPFAEGSVSNLTNVVLSSIWPGAPRVNQVEVIYTVEDADDVRYEVILPTSRPAEPFEFGWRIKTNLTMDAAAIFSQLAPASNFALRETRMRVLVSDRTWRPPGGVYDPEVLVDPNAFTNVTNGFGFVGSGYFVEVELSPLRSDVVRAGFR